MNIFLRDSYGNARLTVRQIMTDPILLFAFGFGTGLSKYMPGTFGTLAAVPLYLALMQTPQWFYIIAIIAVIFFGIIFCERATRKLDVHDFGGIVWDEIAGFLVTMCWLPFSWQSILTGFVMFRLLDILKPWPISWLDRHVSGGLGIMLDDVLAGVFAGLLLRIWF